MSEIRVVWSFDTPDALAWRTDTLVFARPQEGAKPYLLLPINPDGSVQVGEIRIRENWRGHLTVGTLTNDFMPFEVCQALFTAARAAQGGADK